jgi:hypothetical protein
MRTAEVRISCLPRVAAVPLDWAPSHVVSPIDPDLAAAASTPAVRCLRRSTPTVIVIPAASMPITGSIRGAG